jgi:hypothetical protein
MRGLPVVAVALQVITNTAQDSSNRQVRLLTAESGVPRDTTHAASVHPPNKPALYQIHSLRANLIGFNILVTGTCTRKDL